MVRLLGFALASMCLSLEMDFSNPEASLPHAWDIKSINSLMASTTKLIQHAVTIKITPTINRFAQATLDKIESDVLPALEAEHQVSQDLLDREFARFQAIEAEMEAKRDNITSKDAECEYRSSDHGECRHEQHSVATEVTECDEESISTEHELTTCEEYLSITEGDMHDIWCEDSFDALSTDTFRSSKGTMKTYMEQKKKCRTLREEFEEHRSECTTKRHESTEVHTRCDYAQATLEECSCERANLVLHYSERFTMQWSNLTSSYEDLVNTSGDLELQRRREYEGLMIVMCLLRNVVELAEQEGPCNETHVEKVTNDVRACHEEEHDTSHFNLESKPVPDLPPLYEHVPYPCGADFIAEHYSHMPEDAQAKECDNHYCSERLVQPDSQPIVHR